jgi:DNA repair photolyase
MNYREMKVESACKKLKRKMPYTWDLNIYRGCEHGCRYCYAMYSHQYLETEKFFETIYVKTNIVDELEKQLSSKKWRQEVINIGGVTDGYQPYESKKKMMPEILKLLIKYKTPCIISTKSDLILRDYDLIDELSQLTYVNVAATVTTLDEDIRKKLEPNASKSINRFKMLQAFSKTNASTGLHVMPIIPYLTDGYENIDALYREAKVSQVDYVLPGTLYLRGKTRVSFFNFIKEVYPDKYANLLRLYQTGGADKAYKTELYVMVNEIKAKYNLSSSYTKPMKEKMHQQEYTQLSLFD